jgi:hypothetical protein
MDAATNMTETTWRSTHLAHTGSPTKDYNDDQPKTYRLYVLECRCGAIYQGVEFNGKVQ